MQTSDDKSYEDQYEIEVSKLKPRLQRVWQDLRGAVDERFSHRSRAWRYRGYYVKATNNFFVIKPKGARNRIEARVHANRDKIPEHEGIFRKITEHSERSEPQVIVYLVEKSEHIAPVLDAAARAETLYGQGSK